MPIAYIERTVAMTERTKKRAQFLVDVAYVAVIALIVFLFVKYVTSWILPFILAFCIVAVMHPVIARIVKLLSIKREIVAIIVMVLIYAIVGTLLFLLLMQTVYTVRDAFTLLPEYYVSTVAPAIGRLGDGFNALMWNLPEQWQEQAESMRSDILGNVQTYLINISQMGISLLSGLSGRIPSFMIAMLFTIMLSFFISVQYDKLILFFSTQLPSRARKLAYDVRVIIIDTIIKYFRAAITLMFITFTELAIGLLVLGQKNAIPVAAGIAIFDALPFFGTGLIVIPWILVELVQGNYTFALGLAILYGIVTFVRNIIEPKVVGDKLGLNPIVSLVSIYLGYKLIGVLGMIIMPIITQIILELHKKGSIKIFKESIASDVIIKDVPDDKPKKSGDDKQA